MLFMTQVAAVYVPGMSAGLAKIIDEVRHWKTIHD
jgi:hypothetical protein